MKYKIYGHKLSVRSKQLLAILLAIVMISAFIPILGVNASAEEDNPTNAREAIVKASEGGNEGGESVPPDDGDKEEVDDTDEGGDEEKVENPGDVGNGDVDEGDDDADLGDDDEDADVDDGDDADLNDDEGNEKNGKVDEVAESVADGVIGWLLSLFSDFFPAATTIDKIGLPDNLNNLTIWNGSRDIDGGVATFTTSQGSEWTSVRFSYDLGSSTLADVGKVEFKFKGINQVLDGSYWGLEYKTPLLYVSQTAFGTSSGHAAPHIAGKGGQMATLMGEHTLTFDVQEWISDGGSAYAGLTGEVFFAFSIQYAPSGQTFALSNGSFDEPDPGSPWKGDPGTITLPSGYTSLFRLSTRDGSSMPSNFQQSGSPTFGYVGKAISVNSRSQDYDAIDIQIGGFNLQAEDRVTVVGRVAATASGGKMILGTTNASDNDYYKAYTELTSVDISGLQGAFTLTYTIPEGEQGSTLLTTSNIRIQTNGATTMNFIIDDILIARPEGSEPPPIPDPKPIPEGTRYLRITGRGDDWHAVDILLANVGFTSGSSYEFAITGRVHEGGAQMKIGQTSDPWNQRAVATSNGAGDFEIKQTFTYDALTAEISAGQNFRIHTMQGVLTAFDIYTITITRVGGGVIYSMQSDLANFSDGALFTGTNVLRQAGGPVITVRISGGGAPPEPEPDIRHDCAKDGHVWYKYNDDVHSCRYCTEWEPHSYSNFVCKCGFTHPCANGHLIRFYNNDGHNCARNCGFLNFEAHTFRNFVCTGCGFKHPCADGHLIRFYNADGHNCARNCGYFNFEAHRFVDDVCVSCGYNRLTGDIEELPDEIGDDGLGDLDHPGAKIDDYVIISIIQAAIDRGETPVLVLADLVAETGGTVMTAAVFRFIAEQGVDVQVLLPSGYVFTIIASSISPDVGDFDLNIDIYFTNRATTIDGVKFPANSIVIAPNFRGEFGFDILFAFTAEQLAEAGINGNNVRLYHIASDGAITEQGRAKVNDDGSIEFIINRASYYVLSEEDLVAYNDVIPLPEIAAPDIAGESSALLTTIIVIAVVVAVACSVTILIVVTKKRKQTA